MRRKVFSLYLSLSIVFLTTLPVFAEKVESGTAQKGSGKKMFGTLSVIMLAYSAIFAIFNSLGAYSAYDRNTRGTNTTTRFIRNSTGHAKLRRIMLTSGGVAASAIITPALFHQTLGAIICPLPQILPVILCLRFLKANRDSEHRVQDSRYMTKVGQKAAAVAGETAAFATMGPVAAIATAGAIKKVDSKMDKAFEVENQQPVIEIKDEMDNYLKMVVNNPSIQLPQQAQKVLPKK